MIKAIFRFFSGIVKIVIGVVIALMLFFVLLSKGCQQAMLESCDKGVLPASFCNDIRQKAQK